MSNNKNTDIKSSKTPQYRKYMGISIQLVILVGIGIGLGIFLNNKIGYRPLFLIICPMFFLFIGLYSFTKSFLKDHK